MLYQNLTSISSKIIKQRNTWLVIACVMLVSNILLCIAVLVREEKVVLVPPEINKTFWVSNETASREYLEEMSLFLVSLLLDQTPRSIGFKRDVILKYVAPDYYHALFEKLTEQAKYLSEEDITTKFSPISIKSDPAHYKVEVSGELSSFVAGHETSKSQATFDLVFEHRGYKLLLSDFKQRGKDE